MSLESRIEVEILTQPDDATCGPACLHAVYRYYGDDLPLPQLIGEVEQLEGGGTLAVLLGMHALARGYETTLFTFNLEVFDPTWFDLAPPQIREKLREEVEAKPDPRLQLTARAYDRYLAAGGALRFADLTRERIRGYLRRNTPILTGLSATFLYRTARELGERVMHYDDVRGAPTGHFVVLCGYSSAARTVLVADPARANPLSDTRYYHVDVDRLINAIMLGVITYDANLLIARPRRARSRGGTPR